MDAKAIIKLTRDAVENAEARGITGISPESLKGLLANLESAVASSSGADPQVAAASLEQYRTQLTLFVDQHRHVQAWQLENFKSIVALGQAALKSIILINGGAAVALLAFLGHLVANGQLTNAPAPIVESLYRFVLGVLFASVASGTTYASQYFYGYTNSAWCQRIGIALHICTVILVTSSYGLFFAGAYHTYCGFLGTK